MRRPSTFQFTVLGLLHALSQKFGVLSSVLASAHGPLAFDGHTVSLALQNQRSDQALDLGGLGFGFLLSLLGGQRTTHNVLTNIVFLGEVEQLADLAGSLG